MLLNKMETRMKPVEECFYYFPQFKKDFTFLTKNKIVIEIEPEYRLSWNESDKSLGEYFYDFKKSCSYKRPVKGGFWRPIEETFNISRSALKHLVSSNGRERETVKMSKAYEKLMEILVPYREKIKTVENFIKIKNIIQDADQKDYDSMKRSLDKIKSLLK